MKPVYFAEIIEMRTSFRRIQINGVGIRIKGGSMIKLSEHALFRRLSHRSPEIFMHTRQSVPSESEIRLNAKVKFKKKIKST